MRYFPEEALAEFDIAKYNEQMDEILRLLAQNGKALEINTKGGGYTMLGKTYNFHPDFDIVKRFKELGGEYITVGSDAHSAHDVGRGVVEAYEMAEAAGFKYITLYQHGTPLPIKID